MRTGETRERAASARGTQAALAAALAVAGGTSAYGEVVRFDNPAGPGHFHWPAAANGSWLDVTLDAASQPGASLGPTSFRHLIYNDPSYGFGIVDVSAGASKDVAVDTSSGVSVLSGFDSLDLIGAGGETWSFSGYGTYAYYGVAAFAQGVAKYLGLRFDTGGGYQYGWIGVVRTGNELDAFAWGYETEPGVPIAAGAVPAPGSLALLAFGAAAGASRPRRKGC